MPLHAALQKAAFCPDRLLASGSGRFMLLFCRLNSLFFSCITLLCVHEMLPEERLFGMPEAHPGKGAACHKNGMAA